MPASSTSNPLEEHRRDLCAQVFLEPRRFDAAARLVDHALLQTKLHTHVDILQMDVVCHCGGRVFCDGQPVNVKTISVFAFYPNAPHAHELKITSYESEVLTLKLQVDPTWLSINNRTFAPITHAPEHAAMLLRTFRRLAWLSVTGRNHSLASLTALAELFSLWPGNNFVTSQPISAFETSARLDPVLKLIDQSLTSPPDVKAMARVASLSTRQLLRQFAAMMGCTPHEYVSSQRLARAKEMLASGKMNVTEVADALGFATIHSFSRWFLKETKVNPSDFRSHPSTL